MLEPPKCSRCGMAISPDSPGGHCLHCLLHFAIELEDDLVAMGADGAAMNDGELPEVEGCRILEKVGEGGCGVVYRVQQTTPVRREVALKVIKLGMDTRQIMARFEGERQALALMDHPNIAKVFSAAMTRSGRPCFLMELVRGVPITQFCEERSLPLPERIRLFIEVCRAVEHAHQKGVIHRDLKPSNVLVTAQNGEPVPKVIDFGIAKATGDQRLTAETLYTAFEPLLGTPAYMSPEQLGVGATDVDTRSDIYSLGVMLYTLLTGATPHESPASGTASLAEIHRQMRDEETPRPSARFAALPDEARAHLARQRATEPRKLMHTIRGDLDWIAMTALEKDRARRYATANSLAEDLSRYLSDEPINARPPTTLYQLQKFARRHQTAVIAALFILLTLAVAATISTWQAVRARRAEKVALHEEAQSTQVAQFLEDMLGSVNPAIARGRDTTLLRDILDRTFTRIGVELKDSPEIQARLRQIIGWSNYKLGENAQAEESLREAVRLYRPLPSGEVGLAGALNWLSYVVSKRDLVESEKIAREACALQLRLATTLSPASTDAKGLATYTPALAQVLRSQKKYGEATALLQRWLTFQQTVLGKDDPALANTLSTLSGVQENAGDFPGAILSSRRALEIRHQLFDDEDVNVARAKSRLGAMLIDRGNFAEAESLLRQALATDRKLLGPTHWDLLYDLTPLAKLMVWEGRLPEAQTIYEEAMPLCRKASSGMAEHLFSGVNEVAQIYQKQKRFPEAEAFLLQADTIQRGFPAPDPGAQRRTFEQLVELYGAWDKPTEAAPWKQKLRKLAPKQTPINFPVKTQ